MSATGLFYKWLGRKMDEDFESDRLDREARARAGMAPVTLTSDEWQTWKPGEDTMAKNQLIDSPTFEMYRNDPQMADRINQMNLAFRTATPLSKQRMAIANVEAINQNDIQNQIAAGNLTEEQLQQLGGRANFIGARQMGGQQNLNKEIGAQAAFATGKLGGIAANEALAQDVIAQEFLKEQQQLQKLDFATQKANALFDNSLANQGLDNVSKVKTDAAMRRKDLLDRGVLGGLQLDIANNTFGGRVPQAPDGMTWVIDADTGDMKLERYMADPFAAGALGSAAESVGLPMKGLTTRGVKPGTVPPQRPMITGRELLDRIMRGAPKRPAATPQPIASVVPLSETVAPTTPNSNGIKEAINTFRQPIASGIDKFYKHMDVYNNPVPSIPAMSKEGVMALAQKRKELQDILAKNPYDTSPRKYQLVQEINALLQAQ